MLRLETTLDAVIAFLVPPGAPRPRVTLASTRDAVHGSDLRELSEAEWPLIAVRGLSGRAGDCVTVVFDPERSPLPLPPRGEMVSVMLRWKPPPISPDTRAGGEHHLVRAQRKAARTEFERRVAEAKKKGR